MEVVFIRHGETDLNKTSRIQGVLFDKELNAAGKAYAQKASSHFDAKQFDQVFVSPLKRAVETANIFTNNRSLIKDDRLKEYDYGEWDGELLSDMIKQFPDAIDPWGKVAENFTNYAPHAETYAQLKARCLDFLNELAEKYQDQKILVVSHGTLIRMMVASVVASGNMVNFNTIANCALAKLAYQNGIWRLVYYNRKVI